MGRRWNRFPSRGRTLKPPVHRGFIMNTTPSDPVHIQPPCIAFKPPAMPARRRNLEQVPFLANPVPIRRWRAKPVSSSMPGLGVPSTLSRNAVLGVRPTWDRPVEPDSARIPQGTFPEVQISLSDLYLDLGAGGLANKRQETLSSRLGVG
jgi:hypothetical protein